MSKCEARLKLNAVTKGLNVLNEEHMHPPPRPTSFRSGTFAYETIPSRVSGKQLLMYKGYTYTQCGNNYYCSSKKHICRAKLKLDPISKILTVVNEHHVHPPPGYVLTSSRQYVKTQPGPCTKVSHGTEKVKSLVE